MEKDDDYIDEGFSDYRFNEILFELEANGEILKKWEQGEPIEKEPKTEQKPKTMNDEKERKTI